MQKDTNIENQSSIQNLDMSLTENKLCELTECPVITTLSVIGGKWKPAIIWEIQQHEIRRFGQLKKAISGITQKMLTKQLREMEADQIIERTIFAEVPPRVEYRLTDYGKTLTPILNEMAKWGISHQLHGAKML